MSIVQHPISSIEQTIARPITLQVLDKIKKEIFYDNHLEIIHRDHTNSFHTVGSTLSEQGENTLKLESDTKVIALTEETYNSANVLSNSTVLNSVRPVWEDTSIGAWLKPLRTRINTRINLIYKANTRQKALEWQNKYRHRLARGFVVNNLDVDYEVVVPNGAIVITRAIWTAKEANHGDNIEFIDYLKDNFKVPCTIKHNALGNGHTLVFIERLGNIVVTSKNETPEITRVSEGSYESSLFVDFEYERIIGISQQYPMFIHNNYIDPNFINTNIDRNKDNRLIRKSSNPVFETLCSLTKQTKYHTLTNTGYIIPGFDDTYIDYRDTNFSPVFQLRLSVDLSDPTLIINLKNLSIDTNLTLNPQLVPYLMTLKDLALTKDRTLVRLAVARKGVILPGEYFTIDDDYNLRAKNPLDPKVNYHLTLSIKRNLCLLEEEVIETVSQFKDLTNSIIKFIDPNFSDDDLPKSLTDDPYSTIPPIRVKRAFSKVSNCKHSNRVWCLVNTIVIQN